MINQSSERSFIHDELPRPSVVVDPVVLTVEDGRIYALLWLRPDEPDKGKWGLPGVFLEPTETLEGAALRGLRDKAGLQTVPFLEQLVTWVHPDRRLRGWVVVVGYYALAEASALRRLMRDVHGVNLAEVLVPWTGESGGAAELRRPDGGAVDVAFDHADTIGTVIKRLRGKLGYTTIGLELLPERFTLRHMQEVYEALLGRSLNRDSFRRRITRTKALVKQTGEFQESVDHRPAELYCRA